MAERATSDRVQGDMKPPNFRGAIQRLRTIRAKKERVAGINGEISGIYDAVEGYKVNKKAARIFLTLDGLEPDEQQDIFRSLTGLIAAADWQEVGDLVDKAEGAEPGNIVTPDFGGRRKKSDDSTTDAGEPDDVNETMEAIEQMESDGDGEAGETPPAEKPTGKVRRLSPEQAREAAKAHFGEGKAPPVSTGPAPEIYTGDNSDLAGD